MRALGIAWPLDDREAKLVLRDGAFSLDDVVAAIGEHEAKLATPENTVEIIVVAAARR